MRKPEFEGWKKRIFEVQQAYWKGAAVISYEDQQKLNTELSKILETVREQGRTEIQLTHGISELFAINPEKMDWELMKKFMESAKCASMHCSQKMTDFVSRIMGESAKILPQKQPGHFEVVAIGSLARGESTPYSDLEYMILTDQSKPSTVEYLEKLSMTSYFLIGNLGETNLKYMAIKELDGWFQDMAKNGFKIDGLSPGAGNIPTGNGQTDKGYKFITTPDDLFSAYRRVSENPDKDSIRGDLTAMVSYMSLIYSSNKDNTTLLSRLKSKIQAVQLTEERKLANNDMLTNDVKKFSFKPDQRLVGQAYTVDAKRQLYRFPSILLFDLTVIHRVFENDAWATAERLFSMKKISEDFYHSLLFQLAVACYIRLSTYLYHDAQDDRTSVALKQISSAIRPKTRSPGNRWHVHTGLVVALADTMVPMKTELQVEHADVCRVCQNFESHTATSSGNFMMNRIETLQNCGQSALAFQIIEEKVGPIDSLMKCSVLNWFAGRESFFEPRNIQIIARILIDNSRFQEALKLLMHLKEGGAGPEQETTTFHIADCKHRLGEIEQALKILQELETNRSGEYYLSLSRIYADLRQFDPAETSCLSALQIFYEEACRETVYDYYGNPESSPTDTKNQVRDLSLLSPVDRLSVLQHPTPGVLNCIESLANLYREKYNEPIADAYYKHYHRMFQHLYGDKCLVPAAAHGYFVLGASSYNRGRFYEAEKLYNKSLKTYRLLFGENYDHPTVARLYRKMSHAYRELRDFSAAKNCLLISQEMYNRLYGEGSVNADIADVVNDIGLLNYAMSRKTDAKEYFLRALEMYSEISGSHDSLNSANTISHLALTFTSLEEYASSEAHYSLALSMYKRLHGEDNEHPDIAWVLNGLGMNSNHQKEYTRADEYYRLALKLYKHIHGEDGHNPDIAWVLTNLGHNCRDMKKHAKATDHYRLALDMRKRMHGHDSDNQDIALGLIYLGNNYNGMMEYEKAVEHYRLALDMYKRIHGEDSDCSEIAQAHNSRAANFNDMEEFTEAEEQYRLSLDTHERIHGEDSDHQMMAVLCNKLGNNYSSMKKHAEAEEHYRLSLDMYKRLHGEDSENCNIARVLSHLGKVYSNMEEYKKAEENYRLSLDMYKRLHGEDSENSNIARVLNNLGNVYSNMEEYKKAEEHYRLSLDMRKRLHGEDSEDSNIASVHGLLGNNYADMEQYKNAEEHIKRALEMYKCLFGVDRDHAGIACQLRNLGKVYRMMGDKERAKIHLEQAMSMYTRIYRDNSQHPDIQKAVKYLEIYG